MESRGSAAALKGAVGGGTSVPTAKEQKDNKPKAVEDVPMFDLTIQEPETDSRTSKRRSRKKGTMLNACCAVDSSSVSSEEDYEVERSPSPPASPNHPVTLNIKDWKPEGDKKLLSSSDSDSP